MTDMSKGGLDGNVVLVVDDEELLRNTLADALEMMGAKTLRADGGNNALELVKANHVDFILSDVRMRGGTGTDLLAAFRALGRTEPFVLMTGYADFSREDAIQLGASDMLAKPFVVSELLQLMKRLLKKA
jgi:DNA-binding NtrC family response regulator